MAQFTDRAPAGYGDRSAEVAMTGRELHLYRQWEANRGKLTLVFHSDTISKPKTIRCSPVREDQLTLLYQALTSVNAP